MNKPLQPHQPEKFKMVEIAEREEHLLMEMRKYPYGKFLIHKQEGRLLRFEVTKSILIEEQYSSARPWLAKKKL